jgi:hypothetical protein
MPEDVRKELMTTQAAKQPVRHVAIADEIADGKRHVV